MGFAGNPNAILIIANPISGGGRAGRYLDAVAQTVSECGVKPQVFKTARAGDARRAAGEFTGQVILSFGGDGTFNEVLNGADLGRCALGVLPAGAGNVIAKELGVPRDPIAAVCALASGRIVPLDLGVCNGRRFISMVGAGMDAHIVNLIHRRRRGRVSQLHYVPSLLRESMRPQHWGISVSVDDAPLARGANLVCVGNTHSYGGPIEMTPAACPTDGALDVMVTAAGNAVELLTAGLASLLRALHASRSSLYTRGRRVRLTSRRQDVPWQVDGDPGGCLPAELHCEPAGVRVLVPCSSERRQPALLRQRPLHN